MRNFNPELLLLQEYAQFILKNYFREFIQEVQLSYKNLQIPVLKLFKSEEELEILIVKSLTDFLENIAC